MDFSLQDQPAAVGEAPPNGAEVALRFEYQGIRRMKGRRTLE
jgi:hypothetical protein